MAIETFSSAEQSAASRQGWILVMVREQRLRQLLLTLLSRNGYVLLGCPTAAEARQIFRQRTAPRLILLDGAEASEASLREQLHQIKESLAPAATCHVIILSLAHPQPRLQRLPGVDAIIARPFDLTDVLSKVETLMQAD